MSTSPSKRGPLSRPRPPSGYRAVGAVGGPRSSKGDPPSRGICSPLRGLAPEFTLSLGPSSESSPSTGPTGPGNTSGQHVSYPTTPPHTQLIQFCPQSNPTPPRVHPESDHNKKSQIFVEFSKYQSKWKGHKFHRMFHQIVFQTGISVQSLQ